MSNNNLPAVNNVDDITPELIRKLVKDEIKSDANFDYLFFAMKAKENPSVPWPYILEFIKKAAITGADPRLNQIYLIPQKKWDSNTRQEVPMAHTVFAYQFFMDKAYQTGLMEYFTVDTKIDKYLSIENGKPKIIETLVSVCTVKRKDMTKETIYKAHFPEFYKKSPTWNKSPYLMLEKCAIANAMRRAFPEYLTGLYIKDEMPTAINLENKKTDHQEKESTLHVENLNDEDQKYQNEMESCKTEIWKIMMEITGNKREGSLFNEIIKDLGLNHITDLTRKNLDERKKCLQILKDKLRTIQEECAEAIC